MWLKRFIEPPLQAAEEKHKFIIFHYFLGATWLLLLLFTLQNEYIVLTAAAEMAQEYAGFVWGDIAMLVILGAMWLAHRRYPLTIRHIFLGQFIIGAIFMFPSVEIDRAFIILALPVIMAAFLIRPTHSFLYVIIINLVYSTKLYQEGITPLDVGYNVGGVVVLVIIAVVSWLISYFLGRSLAETNTLNRELDQRVQDRTKELAQALRREHTLAVRNKTILESIADGVLVFDANQQVVMANPAASRLAQRDLNAVNLPQFLTTIEDKAGETIQNWMMGQKPPELSNVKFQWDDRSILANVAPVILPGAEASHTGDGNVMVLRDFTKEAALERAKDMFLGMVSHELRTPMSAIQGYVNMLSLTEKERLSTEGREYLQTINVSIKQLLTLANELIDVSRLETGEVALYPQWVNLTAIVNNAVKVVRQEFANRKLTLEVKLAEHLPQLYVDQTRINQVLLNLLSNAYKYTPEGGATLEVSQTNGWVNIVVSDTGVGIKTEDQGKMFERFFRSSDRMVQKAGGTGLGLNISKGLVELHGGQLTFDSTYGQGTTFRVTLPVSSEAALAENLPNGNL